MTAQKDRIEAAIRHIQTSADIDPWAMELAISALNAQDATDTNVGSNGDTIYRQMAIDVLMEILDRPNHAEFLYTDEICRALGQLPSAQPENIIQQFRDYQVEWLTSHCDLELEPTLEEWIVRFLNDTAECFELGGRING